MANSQCFSERYVAVNEPEEGKVIPFIVKGWARATVQAVADFIDHMEHPPTFAIVRSNDGVHWHDFDSPDDAGDPYTVFVNTIGLNEITDRLNVEGITYIGVKVIEAASADSCQAGFFVTLTTTEGV